MNVVPCAKFEHSQKRCLGLLKTPHNTSLFLFISLTESDATQLRSPRAGAAANSDKVSLPRRA